MSVFCLYIFHHIIFIHNIVFLHISVNAHSNCFEVFFQVVGIQRKYNIGVIILIPISLQVFHIKFLYSVG